MDGIYINKTKQIINTGRLREEYMTVDEKINFYTNLLMQSGNRLLNTIGEVLDMSRIESGAVKIEMVRVNVGKMLEESRTNWETLAGKKSLAFEMKLPNTLVQADLDTNLIQQVLNNLIGNSIKFTDQGKIAVSLNYFKQPNSEKGILKINITDTGIGMSKDFVENKLFKAFEQESRGYNRKYEGSGLGLFLCKKFTELMNGTIEVDSKQGKGTTFSLNFPAY
jgi:signal transduction histidine kinase